jgi:hypothetical protein
MSAAARQTAFIEARRTRGLLGLDQAPDTLAEAFAISAGMMKALGETVGGWKVGYAPDGTPVASPMYASGFLKSGDAWTMEADRPMIPEIEIAVRLARTLPANPARPYTRADIKDALRQRERDEGVDPARFLRPNPRNRQRNQARSDQREPSKRGGRGVGQAVLCV